MDKVLLAILAGTILAALIYALTHCHDLGFIKFCT